MGSETKNPKDNNKLVAAVVLVGLVAVVLWQYAYVGTLVEQGTDLMRQLGASLDQLKQYQEAAPWWRSLGWLLPLLMATTTGWLLLRPGNQRSSEAGKNTNAGYHAQDADAHGGSEYRENCFSDDYEKTRLVSPAAKDRAELALKASGLGLWDWDLKTNRMYFDPVWASLFGLEYERLEMDFGTWLNRTHPADGPTTEAALQDYVRRGNQGPQFEVITRMHHASGHWVHALHRGRITERDAQGIATRCTGTTRDVTESHLRQEEQHLILSSTKLGIWKWDPIKDILEWDQGMYLSYGQQPGTFEHSLEAWKRLWDPEYRAEIEHEFRHAAAKKDELDTMIVSRGQDGKPTYFGVRGKVERDIDGRATRIIGINWDQTKAHQAEQNLKAYVKGLNSWAIVAETDRKGTITRVNEKFQELSKYSTAELLGATHRIVNSGHHPRSFFTELWNTISAGHQWKGEIKNKAKDGTEYWVDTTIIPKLDGKGKVEGYLALYYDVTTLKKSQIELAGSLKIERISNRIIEISDSNLSFEDKLHQMLEIILEIDWLSAKRQAGIYLLQGDTGLELTSYRKINQEATELVKEFTFDRCPNDHAVELTQIFRSWQALGREDTAVVATDADGFYNVPLIANKNFFGIMVFEGESGEAKLGELEERAIPRLARVIAEMVERSYAKAEYSKQKQMALHNSKLASIGQLSAGVGHEINNPLAIMTGYVRSLQKVFAEGEVDFDYVRTTLKKIDHASDRIATIVKGLRSFARADTDDQEDFTMVTVMEDSVSLLKDIYEKDGIDIAFQNHGVPANQLYHGNRGRIQQVVMNLISNARDATENQDNRKISVTVAFSDMTFDIRVTDNGKGIPDAIKEKIFEAFFTTKSVNKGTGIGLALCHSIVGEHGGRIEIDTEVGKGTSFILKLPVDQVRLQEASQETDQKDMGDSLTGIRVLLADDEEGIRDILTDILEELGMDVTGFGNGALALEAFKAHPENYDLLISDMQMPELDGPGFLRGVRESGLPQPKFLFITGGVNINFEDADSDLNKMIDGYFFKPFEDDDILEILRKLFLDGHDDTPKPEEAA